jgi:proline iminopeptidase
VQQYWDPNHLLAAQMKRDARGPQPVQDCCIRSGILWDLAAVYPPGSIWSDRMPPATVFDGPVVDVIDAIEGAFAPGRSRAPPDSKVAPAPEPSAQDLVFDSLRYPFASSDSSAIHPKRVGLSKPIALLSIVVQAQQAASREGVLEGADGVKLFYREVGSGPPAVLLHGGPGSNMNGIAPDLEPLAKLRKLVMYDQRGGGRSEIIKDADRLTAAHHVRDLEALRSSLGLRRVALVGESWGAGLAVLYAAAHPNRVERLLLIGPMPPTRAMLERRMDESDDAMGFRKRLDEVRRAMPGSPDPIATCREFFALYLRQFFVTPDGMSRRRGSSCDAPAEGVRNYFVVNDATFASLGNWDFRPLLAKLKMPALVIEGNQSIPSTVESARVFAQSLPNAKLVLIAGAGHYPQVEHPRAFFAAVNEFLARRRQTAERYLRYSRSRLEARNNRACQPLP